MHYRLFGFPMFFSLLSCIIVILKIPGVQNRCNVHIKFPERAALNGTDNGEHPMNGDSPTPPAEDGVKKCDIIQITGKIERVELAKQELLVGLK